MTDNFLQTDEDNFWYKNSKPQSNIFYLKNV